MFQFHDITVEKIFNEGMDSEEKFPELQREMSAWIYK